MSCFSPKKSDQQTGLFNNVVGELNINDEFLVKKYGYRVRRPLEEYEEAVSKGFMDKLTPFTRPYEDPSSVRVDEITELNLKLPQALSHLSGVYVKDGKAVVGMGRFADGPNGLSRRVHVIQEIQSGALMIKSLSNTAGESAPNSGMHKISEKEVDIIG